MARIDLARRAQIGRDRSARTRAELIAAARTLYAAHPFDQVTVDDVVGRRRRRERHFLCALRQPRRACKASSPMTWRANSTNCCSRADWPPEDPIERIAAGCGAFILQTLRDPAWGMLVARSAATMPHVASVARKRLKEDIDRAAREGHLDGVTPELAFDFASGIMLHMMLSAPQRQRSPQQASAIVAGLLRAIGVAPDKAAAVARRAIDREQGYAADRNLASKTKVKTMAVNLVRFASATGPRWGVVRGTGAVPLADDYPTTAALIEHGESDWRSAQAAPISLDTLEFLSPVTTPCRIFCQGANYRQHMIESGLDPDAKTFNMFFTKSDASVAPAIGTLRRPPHVSLLDYEIELALVFRRAIQSPVSVTRETLQHYVFAAVIANDISARDVQLPQTQFFKGKSYRGFCPLGPWLTVLEPQEFTLLDNLDLHLSVNGALAAERHHGQSRV